MNWNRTFIRFNWGLLALSALAMIVCLILFFAERISDRAMLGITLALSWFAVVYSAANVLVTFYVKKDVES